VTGETISAEDLADLLRSPDAGAVVTFSGEVRDHDQGRAVRALTYEAHPTAQQVLEQVAQEVLSRHAVLAIAITHRVGDLTVGDCALAVAVSAAHRGAAFAACLDLVDITKARLPVWKHQIFADGSEEWVNCA